VKRERARDFLLLGEGKGGRKEEQSAKGKGIKNLERKVVCWKK